MHNTEGTEENNTEGRGEINKTVYPRMLHLVYIHENGAEVVKKIPLKDILELMVVERVVTNLLGEW